MKVGFVGSGYMAEEHAKAFSSLENVSLVGVFGRSFESRQRLADIYKMKAVASIQELYKVCSPDLIVIAVDELSIKSVASEAMDFSWKILLEKPPGYNYQDALELLRLAKEKERECYVALNRRFMSSVCLGLEELTKNQERRIVTVTDQEDLLQAKGLGHPNPVLENWMYANSIHIVDLIRFFCRGSIVKVENFSKWEFSLKPQLVLAKVVFDSGDIGHYHGLWNAPGPWSTEVVTSSVRFELRPLESISKQVRGSRILEKLQTSQADLDFKPGLQLQAKNALLMHEAREHNLPSLEDAVESMRLINQIFFSS